MTVVDLSLSEVESDLRRLARDVAERSLGPAVAAAATGDGHLDRESFRRVMADAATAGLQSLLVPVEFGGGGQHAVAAALVGEELGAVDVGLASAINLSMCVPLMVVAAGTDVQRAAILGRVAGDEPYVLAGALNEPDVAGSDAFDPDPTPAGGPRTRARRDGEHWVLDGRKAAWVSNAGAADAYVIFARTDPTVPGPLGTTAFWVPADTAGLSVGARTSLLGMRTAWHAEVLLDDVRVGADAVVGGVGEGLPLMQRSTAPMVVGLAAAFVGLARTAYEMALGYAGERRSWGRPIRDHQAVALMLSDAVATYRRARLAVLEAAWTFDAVAEGRADPESLGSLLPSCKQQAVDAAIANAERAVKVFGAAGVATGVGPEKLLRDAWTGWACDFTGDVLRLATASALPRTP
ncbi:acyl-CoA dehydrogenase family protein [Micromonospora marina]|uniref:acyl-CoA dehydrogenase family protein n=1 Tax=Micromonospora marina TaxID=307120 RepID=UPI003455CC85